MVRLGDSNLLLADDNTVAEIIGCTVLSAL